MPGSSPDRLAKRWPAAHYEALAQALRKRNVSPVIIGSAVEQGLAAEIPTGMDLTGQTSFGDLADLARAGQVAIGNDTGPMHLLSAAGCPSVTLFSGSSNPSQCAPVGRWTRVLQRSDLNQLPVETVLAALPETVLA